MYFSGSTVEAMMFIVVGLMLVAILIRILIVVHRQAARVRELEDRIKTYDHADNKE